MLILRAIEEPLVLCLYARRTLGLAKSTMWLQEPRDGIPAVLRELGLLEDTHYTLNLSASEVHFSNGSIIRLCGYERSGWADVRGHKFVLLVLDEMQEQEVSGLKQALQADIPYCFFRHGGRFVGIGTPGVHAIGPFYDICEGVPHPDTGLSQGSGWVVHRWTAEALKAKTPVWDGMLRWKIQFNIPDDFPRWRRDGLGLWASDDSSLMLSIPDSALWSGLYSDIPESIPSRNPNVNVRRTERPNCYAGLDFGFRAPSALVVISAAREEGTVREHYSESRAELLNDDLAAWCRDVMKTYDVRMFYADHARPDIIEEFRRKHGLPIIGCDKGDYDFRLQEMRTMVHIGRLQLIANGALCTELKTLVPDPKLLLKGQTRPKAGQPDHCFDALRYVWNGIHSNYIMTPEAPLSPIEQRELEVQKMASKQFDEQKRRQADPRQRTTASRR